MSPETLEGLTYLGMAAGGFICYLAGEYTGKATQKVEMLQKQLKGEATQIGESRYFLIEEAHWLYIKQQAKAFQDGVNGAIKARHSVAQKINPDSAAHPEQYKVRALREVNKLSDKRFGIQRD